MSYLLGMREERIVRDVVAYVCKEEKNQCLEVQAQLFRSPRHALNSTSLISLQTISDVDLRWRAAISFYTSTSLSSLSLSLYLCLSLFLPLLPVEKTPDLSSPFTPFHKLPVRLSRLVRTTSMIIRFCIAKCLCLLWFLFFWIASMPAVRSVSLLSIRLTTKLYG